MDKPSKPRVFTRKRTKDSRQALDDQLASNTRVEQTVAPQDTLGKQRSFVNDLRARLRRYRMENEFTQAAVAEFLGVGQTTVAQFENGGALLREASLDKLFLLLAQPTVVIANRLRNLADYLDSPAFGEPDKVEELKHFLGSLQKYISSMLAVEKLEP